MSLSKSLAPDLSHTRAHFPLTYLPEELVWQAYYSFSHYDPGYSILSFDQPAWTLWENRIIEAPLLFSEKVQAEIDSMLGQSQQPNSAIPDAMAYTNAVIHKVLRMKNIIPMNVPREVALDTTLAGYHMPKVIRGSLTAKVFKLLFVNTRNLN